MIGADNGEADAVREAQVLLSAPGSANCLVVSRIHSQDSWANQGIPHPVHLYENIKKWSATVAVRAAPALKTNVALLQSRSRGSLSL